MPKNLDNKKCCEKCSCPDGDGKCDFPGCPCHQAKPDTLSGHTTENNKPLTMQMITEKLAGEKLKGQIAEALHPQPEENLCKCDRCGQIEVIGKVLEPMTKYTNGKALCVQCAKDTYPQPPLKGEKCPSCLAGFSKEDIAGNCTCDTPAEPKKEKECSGDENCQVAEEHGHTPELPESWKIDLRNFVDEFFHEPSNEEVDDLVDFIAAKKVEWEDEIRKQYEI